MLTSASEPDLPAAAQSRAREPLRVLAVSHAYPRRNNASHGIFVHRLHAGMRRAGTEVTVLQLHDWAPPWPLSSIDPAWRRASRARRELLDEVDGVAVHHPRTFTPRPSRFFPGDTWERECRAIVDYCRNTRDVPRPDIVLGHFMVPDGFHAIALGRALDVPVAVMAWGDDLHNWPEQRPDWRRRLQQVLDQSDLLIACSRRLVSDGNRWLRNPRDDWQVIYGGVDLERFSASTDVDPVARDASRRRVFGAGVESRQVLVCLAQATAAKGYAELLDAWSDVARSSSNWTLVMGGGPGELDIPAEIVRRGLESSAIWIGPVAPNDVSDVLKAADGFVLPSHAEGLSLAMLEALACAVPTIATAVGGHDEVIRDSAEGWLIPPRDVAALAKALRELTSSPSERLRRGRAGRAAAERIGSPDTNGRRLAELLAGVVARRL
ncbi:MAG TPA: glycosyltransferase [Vicinamibacterales bacterium]|nr:glycosyltransferase [Vicinamibacterales bacterium]